MTYDQRANGNTICLVMNAFLSNKKFNDLYRLLITAASEQGANLIQIPTTDISKALLDFQGADCAASDHLESAYRDLIPDGSRVIFWDKDVTLARNMELAGMRLFNSPDAIAACDDKAITASILLANDLPMPRTYISPLSFSRLRWSDAKRVAKDAASLGYPIVFKRAIGSFGAQVELARNEDDLIDLILEAGEQRFLLQRFVSECSGTDIRVNIVGDEVVSAMRRTSDGDDFRSNISAGGCGTPYVPTAEEADLAIKATKALGLDFSGVDILQSNSGPVICEVNSNPQFRSSFDATGINMADHIIAHVLACERA